MEEGQQPASAIPPCTLVIEGEQARSLSVAAQAAESREQAVLASRDPLQDNRQALELEAELEQELEKPALASDPAKAEPSKEQRDS